MSPRTGRPKAENPKDIRFSIRLDAATFAKLKERSEREGFTIAETVRQAITAFLAKK